MELSATLLFAFLAVAVFTAIFSIRRAREQARRKAMETLAHWLPRRSFGFAGPVEKF